MTSEDTSRRVRLSVLEHVRDYGVPPSLERIMQRFGLDRQEGFRVLRSLEDARHLKLLPGTQRILMAFPFSAIGTPFRVIAEGQTYYANCAWDAVAIHATLDARIRIESFCHHCGAELTMELADGHVTEARPPNPLVYIALPAARWWEDIVNTCSNHMVFFLSQEHLDAWRATHPEEGGQALTVEKTHRLGLPIYRDKMSLDYARPSKEALVAHFAALDLTGDFWEL